MATFAANMPVRQRIRCVTCRLVAALVLSIAGAAPVAVAGPAAIAPESDGSHIVSVRPGVGRQLLVTVYSTAMAAPIDLEVYTAQDVSRPAPALYLLNGASGGSEGSNWTNQTDVAMFFADKQVNIVIPIGGSGSYFTDWHTDDPILGRQQWTTFLTRELPPLIETTFHGSGANAIAGISMAATSVFQLALAAPGLYQALGSYSGCVRTSDPRGQAMVAAVVGRWKGNPLNMWGGPQDPTWAANDPYLHADRLRNTTLYISTGTGQPGPLDTLDQTRGDAGKLVGQLTSGALLEAITSACTLELRDRLRELNIPATFDLRPSGTHSWGYWQQDLHNSWPLFEAALNK
nr:alpha/beta hydrolase family protein [Nocardia colli]